MWLGTCSNTDHMWHVVSLVACMGNPPRDRLHHWRCLSQGAYPGGGASVTVFSLNIAYHTGVHALYPVYDTKIGWIFIRQCIFVWLCTYIGMVWCLCKKGQMKWSAHIGDPRKSKGHMRPAKGTVAVESGWKVIDWGIQLATSNASSQSSVLAPKCLDEERVYRTSVWSVYILSSSFQCVTTKGGRQQGYSGLCIFNIVCHWCCVVMVYSTNI